MQIYDTFFNLGYYQRYTPEQFKEMAMQDEFIAKFYPFIEKVSPALAEIQDLKDVICLICLEGRVYNQANQQLVVLFGLSPLVDAGIITEERALEISDWFKNTSYRQKEIGALCDYVTIGDFKYTIFTYAGNFQRCVVLAPEHIKPELFLISTTFVEVVFLKKIFFMLQ